MKKKRILSLLLACVMVFALIPVTALAEGENAAKIGETEYATLQAAVDAAQSGDTVTLLRDAAEDVTVTGKNITIDLGNHTLTGTTTALAITGGSVTVQNGTIQAGTAPNSMSGGAVDFRYSATEDTLTLKNLTVNGCSASAKGHAIFADNPRGSNFYCSAVLENVHVTGCGFGGARFTQMSSVKITGSSFNNNHSAASNNTVSVVEFFRCLIVEMTDCTVSNNEDNTTVLEFGGYKNRQGTVYDRVNATLTNCNIKNNKGVDNQNNVYVSKIATITFNGCVISDNTMDVVGGIALGATDSSIIVNLNNTVVKNNHSNSSRNISWGAGGVGIRKYNTLNFNSGAIYNNTTAGENHANDVYIDGFSNLIAANTMRDFTDPSQDFMHSVWFKADDETNNEEDVTAKGSYTARQVLVRNVAQITKNEETTKYTSLSDAVEASESGDTIVLIAGDDDEFGTTFRSEPLTVGKNVTIELNGRTVKCSSPDEPLITTGAGADLKLTGPGTVDEIYINEGSAAFDGKIDFAKGVRLAASQKIKAGENFSADALTVKLTDEEIAAYNALDPSQAQADRILIENCADSDIAAVITIQGLTNPTLYLTVSDGNIVLRKDTAADDNGVFIDGLNGADTNAGTKASPVKTIAKAKQLLTEQNKNTVYVLGCVTVAAAESWDLEGKTLQRYPSFLGNLVKITADGELTLGNIVIDGYARVHNGNSLIDIAGGKLVLNSGAILQNNDISNNGASEFSCHGGAVNAVGGEITMNSGTIRNCAAIMGGGISLDGATLTINDGLIESCKAVEASEENNKDLSAGGGVFAAKGSKIFMHGGTIRNNRSVQNGGGISLGGKGTEFSKPGSTFFMDGGAFTGNTALYCGGGLFVQCDCVAHVEGGTFTDNEVKNGWFGGGAVYVNGGYPNLGENGHLYLYNASIHGNSASNGGGGLALCPSSQTNIFENCGAVIYGNTSSYAQEIFIDNNPIFGYTGDLISNISEYMLGGGAFHWRWWESQEEATWAELHSNLPLKLYNTLTAEDEDVINGEALAEVYMTGNKSLYQSGGAIGSNGNVTIGSNYEEGEAVSIRVRKDWNDAGHEENRPDKLIIWLERNGERIISMPMTPDENGVWQDVIFENQPRCDADGVPYLYTVDEDSVEGYFGTATPPHDHGDGTIEFIITNTYMGDDGKISTPGLEKWIISEDPIICFGDTFRSGGTYVSIKIGDQKVLTTKDRFAFEGDGSTDQLIASFLANNPDVQGHNEYQWGYKAVAVPGHPHCLKIVPAEPAEGEEAKPHITADECEIVGMGGHDRIFMPLSHRVKHYDVQPGDTVTFELISNVPDTLGSYLDIPPADDPEAGGAGILALPERGQYILTFHDVLDPAMTYADSLTVTVNGVTLDSSLYTVTLNPEDGCTFHVTMDLVEIYETGGYFTFEEIEDCPPIIVTYNATVNEETTHGAYTNRAWVTYETGESEEDIVYVHVYAIDIYKYDQNNEQTPLPGAEFVLFKDEAMTQIAVWTLIPATADKPAYYRFNEWVDTPEGNPPEYTDGMILVSGADGKIILEGLLPGTYWLKETKAPEGYIMSDVLLEVTITAIADPAAPNETAHIVHTKFANSNIPHTGGSGTRLFTLAGSALLITAAALLCFRRKRKNLA